MSKQRRTLDDISSYPLDWPEQQERTPREKRLKNDRGWADLFSKAFLALEYEMARSRISDYRLSTDVRPHSRNTETLSDPGVALWFMKRDPVANEWRLSVLASDRFRKVGTNLKAIELTLQRLRLIGEYGCYTFDQAVRGAAYLALPPPPKNWWEVLHVDRNAPLVVCEAVHRQLAKEYHPDTAGPGAEGEFQAVNQAIAACRAEKSS